MPSAFFFFLWSDNEVEANVVNIVLFAQHTYKCCGLNNVYLYPTVNSYVNDFLSDSKTSQDSRQFSRHLLANLTALLGLQDTYLFADVVFQDSFLPRSIGLNLSSPLLKHVGGSIQVPLKICKDLEHLCYSSSRVLGLNNEVSIFRSIQADCR